MTKPVIRLSYPPLTQLVEFLQTGAGLMCTLGPLLFLSLPRWLAAIFGLGAALFVTHFLQVLARQMTRIELSEESIRVSGPHPATIEWRALRHLALRYYPRNREGKRGWMRLTIRGEKGRAISFDSDLDRFDRLLAVVVRAGIDNELAFDQTTLANLTASGQHVAESAPRNSTSTASRGTAVP